MPRVARLDIFALRQIRYVFASLKLDMISIRAHAVSISSASAHIERASVYRKSAIADLYRCEPALWQVRRGHLFFYFVRLQYKKTEIDGIQIPSCSNRRHIFLRENESSRSSYKTAREKSHSYIQDTRHTVNIDQRTAADPHRSAEKRRAIAPTSAIIMPKAIHCAKRITVSSRYAAIAALRSASLSPFVVRMPITVCMPFSFGHISVRPSASTVTVPRRASQK